MGERVPLFMGWRKENAAFLSGWGKESARSITKTDRASVPRESSNGASYTRCYYPGSTHSARGV